MERHDQGNLEKIAFTLKGFRGVAEAWPRGRKPSVHLFKVKHEWKRANWAEQGKTFNLHVHLKDVLPPETLNDLTFPKQPNWGSNIQQHVPHRERFHSEDPIPNMAPSGHGISPSYEVRTVVVNWWPRNVVRVLNEMMCINVSPYDPGLLFCFFFFSLPFPFSSCILCLVNLPSALGFFLFCFAFPPFPLWAPPPSSLNFVLTILLKEKGGRKS